MNKPNRDNYIKGRMTHREYYLQVAAFIGATMEDVPFSIEAIKNSKDEHLNDLPLSRWDAEDWTIRCKAFKAGYKAWSLCDTVCTLKAIAKNATND